MLIKLDDVKEEIRRQVKEAVEENNSTAKICAVQAAKELRNAAMVVLRGQRNGRIYHVPGTKRTTYTASAPGEAPARRTGTLRESWQMGASYSIDTRLNLSATAYIYSDVPYAKPLEEGTSRVARRPYRDRIIERARPRVARIFKRMTTGR